MSVTVTAEGLKVGVSETTTTTRIMYRCRRCNVVTVIDYPTTVRTEWSVREGQTQGQHTAHVFETDAGETHWLPQHDCPRCRRMMTRDALTARLNLKVACSPACTGAVGPTCVCSCAGANHGSKWIVSGKG